MKAEKGKAIFTAECCHSFHFSCIGENVKHGNLLCPICRCTWKEIPFQFATDVTIVRQILVLHHVNRSRPLPTVFPPPPQHVQFSDAGSSIIDVIGYNIGSDVQHSGHNHDSSALYAISDTTFSFIQSFVTVQDALHWSPQCCSPGAST
ncbi:hypothetical protein MTR67_007716 [Solanum verrucosum]|uniref:Zinc finger C3HC4 RING-type domain-containing protein n=1 Tax=Solanum verrucosum TaxID=315347 RepID=A0AAF0TCZ8_SOLVR|nr:hypothetical protein MTR67_007716 [Solanum verrucosum]